MAETCVLNVGIIRKLMICYWCRVSLQAAPRFCIFCPSVVIVIEASYSECFVSVILHIQRHKLGEC